MEKQKEQKKDFCAQVTGELMLKEIQKGFNAENIVLSPLSYTVVLNMTAAEATGPTLKQMLEYLAVEKIDYLNTKFLDMAAIATTNSDGGPDVCFLSALWVEQQLRLKKSYQELVKNVYKTRAKSVDFEKKGYHDNIISLPGGILHKNMRRSNAWAKSATKGLIDQVLKPKHIKEDTKLLLGNALHFKGTWKDNFIERLTQNKDFYLLNGDKVSVPFMTGCHNYLYGSFESYQAVKISYEKGKDDKKDFSMYFFLPNERDGLPSLLKKVNSDSNFFTQDFELWKETLDAFCIPKFKFSFTTEEGEKAMQEMGMTLPFEKTCKDLTEVVENKNVSLYVSMIIQKAFVEIDEKCTEAAVVTFESEDDLGCCLYQSPPKKFVADQSFLFMIREEITRSVLFTGAVLNPLLNGSDDTTTMA
ncbi:serpin-Z10-like [Nicotiana tabacum]|uniref:Serpin-Z10-like n=1 Tax=Nicotiana tabacum TaxID=4097 RepID=A0AC58RX38_TOBAC